MSVYFIRAGDSGPVKIGFAAEPQRRLRYLQTTSHARLQILRVVEGDRAVEKYFHQKFSERRLMGEWFRFSDEMLTEPPIFIPRNIAESIKRLGGPAVVAAGIAVEGEHPTPAAVTMWGQRNEIPWKWRETFSAMVAREAPLEKAS